ncbi:kinase-like domain-containing protein [Gigaspora rosea]|uniref:Kinase-like domain-containing protein n=1 Tax=Gigaspora rosea TaxID=44941 RepID=A0A397URU9_9GLOM|nr:kinase-like domain-containing protein [Gigaspora rosea]
MKLGLKFGLFEQIHIRSFNTIETVGNRPPLFVWREDTNENGHSEEYIDYIRDSFLGAEFLTGYEVLDIHDNSQFWNSGGARGTADAIVVQSPQLARPQNIVKLVFELKKENQKRLPLDERRSLIREFKPIYESVDDDIANLDDFIDEMGPEERASYEIKKKVRKILPLVPSRFHESVEEALRCCNSKLEYFVIDLIGIVVFVEIVPTIVLGNCQKKSFQMQQILAWIVPIFDESFPLSLGTYHKHSDLKCIGKGGYAVVYSAIFEGQIYAIKSLKNNLSFDDEAFKQVKRELKFLSTVDHPNIIKFHGISRDEKSDNFMLILQFANGGNLRTHLEKKRNNGIYKILWNELIKIAIEITYGLKYLHDKNIIHRDLHSLNILIHDDRAMITDFGLSKQLDGSTSTSKSGVKGVAAYIEPQHYIQRGKNVKSDKKSDIYSLGVLLWELTSGIPPFNGLNDLEINFKIADNEREKTIPGTPPDYVNLFKECWSSEPKTQFSRMRMAVEECLSKAFL